jgi:hypothetical protein
MEIGSFGSARLGAEPRNWDVTSKIEGQSEPLELKQQRLSA